MNITYVTGDATDPIGYGNKIIPHICNDCGRWGSGFVLAVSKKWKSPEKMYREWFDEGSRLGEVQIVGVERDIVVANMIAQHDTRWIDGLPPIRYDSLRECLKKVYEYAKRNDCSVHAPKFGASLAGGSWDIIEKIIQEELCDKGISVTVYNFEDKKAISYVG